ncbi:MAG: nuclear transport factor 2 family protein [Nitratireductor sp.]|nr:nuclear transport factor 2 family protein [Nitratireductor sp.]
MSETQGKPVAGLEARIRRLEDKLDIYELIAGYGPAVDTRSANATAAIWAQSGRYDFGGEPLEGAEAVGGLVDLDEHVDLVERGCAHVMAMPMVFVDGDRAVATGYSRVYLHEGDGWKVKRTSANRWELVRTEQGWKVENRINRLMDGSPDGLALLGRGIADNAKRKVRT